MPEQETTYRASLVEALCKPNVDSELLRALLRLIQDNTPRDPDQEYEQARATASARGFNPPPVHEVWGQKEPRQPQDREAIRKRRDKEDEIARRVLRGVGRVPALVIGALLIAAGLYIASTSAMHAVLEWRLVFGEGATATVPVVAYMPRTEVRRGGGNRSYEVTAHYHKVLVAGTAQEIRLDEPSQPGTTIEVMYLPDVPSHIELAEDREFLGGFAFVMILMSVFFLSFASFGLMIVMGDMGKFIHAVRRERPEGSRPSPAEMPIGFRLWIASGKIALIASLIFVLLGTANQSLDKPVPLMIVLAVALVIPTAYYGFRLISHAPD